MNVPLPVQSLWGKVAPSLLLQPLKKESFLSVLSRFSLLHMNPETTEVRTFSDGQIKPNQKHMLHRCLFNIQMRALADAGTYVSGKICIKCKHRSNQSSKPQNIGYFVLCAFQFLWNLYDFDSLTAWSKKLDFQRLAIEKTSADFGQIMW